MPIKWICKECGHLLAVFEPSDGSREYATTKDVLRKYELCSNCGRELSPPEPEDVEIKPFEGTKR